MLKEEIEELKGSVENMEKQVHEQSLALEMLSELKKTTKRWFVVSIILLIALVGTNVAWLIYESSFKIVTETQTVEQHQEDKQQLLEGEPIVMEKEKLEEENVNKLDFTKFELDYILQNANFNDIQLRIFERLTDKQGRQKIVKIAIEENISERTVSRIIKQIKNKIKRLL